MVGLAAFHQLPNANGDNEEPKHPAEGEKITGRVLDVSRREGVVDIGARPSLTGAKVGKKGAKALTTAELKKRKAAQAGAHKLEIGSKVTAEVELVKPGVRCPFSAGSRRCHRVRVCEPSEQAFQRG